MLAASRQIIFNDKFTDPEKTTSMNSPSPRNRMLTFLNEHFGALFGAFVAVLSIIVALMQFAEQSAQFRKSIALQSVQFEQQEKRLQRQRYTELVGILWSDKDGVPTHNVKLRTEAAKEFIQTKWILALNLSTNLDHARLENTSLNTLNLATINLNSTNIIEVTLSFAHLNGANLNGVSLSFAHINGADLQKAHLYGADLIRADLLNVKNLTCEKLQKAKNWQFAYRDKKLACGAAIPVKSIPTF
jgi:uncharacterized protein YjbI with pentapeptide repeats